MLDIGWTELVVIAIILIVVVGPKDLPPMLRAFGRMTAKMRGMAGDFRRQFDEALREADLDDVRKTISDAQSLNPTAALRDAMNPLRQLGDEIKSDLQKATTPEKPAQPAVSEPVAATVGAPAIAAEKAEPAEPAGAAAPDSASRQPVRAEEGEKKAGEAKPKRTVKSKASTSSAKSSASAVKKASAKKTDARAETKTQKTRAASRKKGDA